jgi:hypothetical protein
MRIALILLFCTAISFSASAQWWHIDLKKHQRYPQLAQVKNHAVKRLPVVAKLTQHNIRPFTLAHNDDYSLEVAEEAVMKTAQHNMRFRIYDVASYNFSDLAQLYIQQNRLSEAKWYFLQSNNISRQQNDDKHTITNLMALAMIKANMGDVILAQQDLTEARALAMAKSWTANIADIDKEVKYIQLNRSSASKTEMRYADAVTLTDKKTD